MVSSGESAWTMDAIRAAARAAANAAKLAGKARAKASEAVEAGGEAAVEAAKAAARAAARARFEAGEEVAEEEREAQVVAKRAERAAAEAVLKDARRRRDQKGTKAAAERPCDDSTVEVEWEPLQCEFSAWAANRTVEGQPGQTGDRSESRMLRRRTLRRLKLGEPCAERAWAEQWRENVLCWIVAFPLSTQHVLGNCASALALVLGSHLDTSWRATQATLGRQVDTNLQTHGSFGAPVGSFGAPACKRFFEALEESKLELPSVPDFPENPSFRLPPIPRLYATRQNRAKSKPSAFLPLSMSTCSLAHAVAHMQFSTCTRAHAV